MLLKKINCLGCAVIVASALITPSVVFADDFPSKPVRLVVPVAAGGWGDITTRIIAQQMGVELGQSVIVENRTGAGGLVGIRYVKQEQPDGYTVLATGGTIAIQQAISSNPGYDALKDFVGIGQMVRSPALIITGGEAEYKSLSDLLAKSKANPNQISYGSAGVGTTTHIAAEMLLQKAGVQMLHVPYKGNGAAMPDVISGRVSFMVDAFGSSSSNLSGGRLKALAVTSDERLTALPDVPTAIEQGVPGMAYYYWLGLFAPTGTPPEVVQKLSAALGRALDNPKIKARLESDGTATAFSTPKDFSAFLSKDVAETQKLADEMGIPKQ